MSVTVTNKGNTPQSSRVNGVQIIIPPGQSYTFSDKKDADAFVLDCTASAYHKPVFEVK